MPDGETRDIGVDGHRLHTVSSGEGPPTFLCLHGLVDTFSVWNRLAGPLAERGRVVRVDQRGHGQSDAPPGPYSLEDLAGDAAAVLDDLRIDQAILVGHSMGGVVALTAALEHPERVAGLVLLGTTSDVSERVSDEYDRIARAGEEQGTEGIARAIYGETTRRRIEGNARGIAAVTRALGALHRNPLTPKLERIQCPTLVMVGTDDPMGTKASEIIAAKIPGRIDIIQDMGHWLHVESPETILEAMDRWRRDTGL